MRGPLVLVATVLVGGVVILGLSRGGSSDVSTSDPSGATAPASAIPGATAPSPAASAPASGAPSSIATTASVDPSLPVMKVFKSPTCGCCTAWIEHLQAAGFQVEVTDTNDMVAIKTAMGIPPEMGSCHTAEIDGVLIEGHVPAADIADFMAERPEGVRGLAVPGMPVGSPGMEVAGQPADPYDVVAFSDDGSTSVYRSHR